MKTNTAIFKLKQLVKRLESGKYRSADIYSTLYELRNYMKDNNLPECERKIRNVYHIFKGSRRLGSMTHELEGVRRSLLAIKEKNTTMARREAAARSHFFHKGRQRNTVERELCKYDIIYAPTQGGYHYCIVNDVKKNFVECYPMTTAKAADLDMLAVQYCELEHPLNLGGDSPVVYLTSSRRMIPKCKASHSFIGHYFCPQEIDDAISSFSVTLAARV